jgi:hypothetical protein
MGVSSSKSVQVNQLTAKILDLAEKNYPLQSKEHFS